MPARNPVEDNRVRCHCGRWISFEDMQDGSARHEFTPDTHFTAERSEWTCRLCVMKETKRRKGVR